MTKNLHDDALKSPLEIEDTKIARVPKTIDHSMIIGESSVIRKPKTKMNNRMVKSKMPVKKICRLEKATQHLYDLEDAHGPEKPLNIDFGLYQMEDY
ncbi:MAG: hypothetical protein ACXV2C_01025 [Candidatus Bathyarchaeia archaeon]